MGRWPGGLGGWVGGGETGEKKEEEMRQWVTRIQLEETVCQGALRQLITMTPLRGAKEAVWSQTPPTPPPQLKLVITRSAC